MTSSKLSMYPYSHCLFVLQPFSYSWIQTMQVLLGTSVLITQVGPEASIAFLEDSLYSLLC